MISVIVPIYNVEKYLNRCIESIVNQTYQNLEIILVDDGSQDKSPMICDKWVNKDNRIKVLHKTNGGLSSARNVGLSIANGEYIAFVDSDDWIHPDMYEKMLDKMEKHNVDLVTCGRYLTYEDGTTKRKHVISKSKIYTSEEAIKEILTNGAIEEAAWDKLYKKHLFNNLYFPEGEINEDIVIMPEILHRCEKICHAGDAYYYYCLNGTSITRSGYNANKRIVFSHLLDINKFIFMHYPSLIPSFHVLEAKYSLTTLYLLEKNSIIKNKFYDDYTYIRHIFKQSFKYYLRCSNFKISEKMKGILMYLNLYSLIRNLKNTLKSILVR